MHATPTSADSRTKIIATVGPACRDPARLRELVAAGVSIFRLNMAHASRDEHAQVVGWIRAASAELVRPIGILCDLAGPKIRVGELAGGQIELREGQQVRFVRGSGPAGPGELTTTYEPLVDDLAVGDRVMLVDGTIGLEVEEKATDFVRCRVLHDGLVRSRQGINLPGVKLSVASMTEADLQNAVWAAEHGIDFVGLSFVRAAADVRQLKELLRSRGSTALVIAKIEKPEALDQLNDIVVAADGVMVARGDLGVEIDVAQMPVVQKQIVAACQRFQKPAIIATQMLDSMQHSPRPTRAEVTDVANAILDGCDACMLSGETAIGEYPRQAVEMMRRIALATEAGFPDRPPLPAPEVLAEGVHPITQAVVAGVSRIAKDLSPRLIAVASRSGATALAMAKQRNFVETVGISDSESTLRHMCLFWGVTPLAAAPASNIPQIVEFICRWGRDHNRLASGDRIILVAGTGLSTAGHNVAVVHEVK